jgi:hypothetical protein
MDHQKAVADAAATLLAAIQAAQAAGYRVDFPTYALSSVAVSETKKVAPASAEPETPPVPVLGRRNPPPAEKATDPGA